MAEVLSENKASQETAGPSGPSESDSKMVFINYIPITMNYKQLKDFLQTTYGPVSKLIYLKHKQRKGKYALVTFTKPETADSAIESKSRWPNGKRIFVKRHLDKFAKPKNSDTNQSSYLENLAPDYLFHIYQYLDPLDIANASEASTNLSNFAEANIYKKYANCEIFNSDSGRVYYSLKDFKCIVNHFGKHFKRMTIDADYLIATTVHHLVYILKNCPNLDELSVLNFTFTKNAIKILCKEDCSIRHLSFECEGVDDRFHKLLQLWPKVTAFTINRFADEKLPAQIVSGIQSLEQLNLINGMMTSATLFRELKKHQKTIRKLSLIEMNDFSENRYKNMGKYLPNLEHLQISVGSSAELSAIAGMNLKFLQLVNSTNVSFDMDFVWSLSGLTLLEELDLVEIAGSNIKVAADVPTLRTLSIQFSSINKEDGFTDTISKLPNLERLKLRNCRFCPDDLLNLIKGGKLKEIEINRPSQQCTMDLILSLVERSKTSAEPLCPSFQLRIIVDYLDKDLAEPCSQLPYISLTLTKNNNLENRFDHWDKLLEDRAYEDYDDLIDEDDFFDDYDDDDYDSDNDHSDFDEFDQVIIDQMNENGLGLGNAILDDIFNHMF